MLYYMRRPFHSCIKYYYKTGIDVLRVISFLGMDGQTSRHEFVILIIEICRHTKKIFILKLKIKS